jgi:hypothetical protein
MFVKDSISSDNRVTAVNQTMAKLSDDPNKQVDVLARNNETYDAFTAVLVNGFNEASRPEYNPLEAGENDPVMQGLELYRLMKFRGGTVANNHTTEEQRVFYDAVLTLETSLPTEQAIALVKSIDPDIDKSISMKLVDEQVGSLRDEQTSYYWYSYIPFMKGEKFVPQNVSEMTSDIRRLAQKFVQVGIDGEKAVELAAKDYGSTHKRVRNVSMKITTDLPEDIEELADVGVQAAMRIITEGAYDEDDLSIVPVSKDRTDRFRVVYEGGIPVQDKDGNFIEYEVGKPIINEQVAFMGLQPTEIDGRQVYPGNTLRGMRDAEKLSESTVSLAQAIAKQNIQIKFKTGADEYSGLTRKEANLLKSQQLKQVENIGAVPEIEKDTRPPVSAQMALREAMAEKREEFQQQQQFQQSLLGNE